jgi:hypothetical protein
MDDQQQEFMRSVPYFEPRADNESERQELQKLIDDPTTDWPTRTRAEARLDELQREAAAGRLDRRVREREAQATAQQESCTGVKEITGTYYGDRLKPGTATMLVPAPSLQQEVAALQAQVERETAKLTRAGLVTNVPPKEEELAFMPIKPYWTQ